MGRGGLCVESHCTHHNCVHLSTSAHNARRRRFDISFISNRQELLEGQLVG